MVLYELISKITNIPITVMCKKDDNNYTLVYRGDSRFFRMNEQESGMWVHHIAPHRENSNELFILVEE